VQAVILDAKGAVASTTKAFTIDAFPTVGQAAVSEFKVPADLPAGTYYLKATPSTFGAIYADSQAITVK